MKPLPQSFEELVEELDKDFPNQCPDYNDTDKDIWIAVGCRKVIDHIRLRIQETERADNVWKETVRTS